MLRRWYYRLAETFNDDNIGVVADGTDTLMLRLAKDLKGLNSTTFNNGYRYFNTVVNGGGSLLKVQRQ